MFSMLPYTNRSNSLMNLFDEMDRNFFPAFSRTSAFRTDIRDAGDHYELKADLPGFAKEDIDLQVQDGVLIISAKREETKESQQEKGGYLCRERHSGCVARSFSLDGIQEDNITAEYADGVLTLRLPKAQAQEPQSRRIAIQ